MADWAFPVCNEWPIERRFFSLWTFGTCFGILDSWSRCFAVRVPFDQTGVMPRTRPQERDRLPTRRLPPTPQFAPIRQRRANVCHGGPGRLLVTAGARVGTPPELEPRPSVKRGFKG